MKVKKSLFIGAGVLLVLAVAVSLAFASDASPAEEPAGSPFFDATLQQAVDELDGKAKPPVTRPLTVAEPTRHYTTDPNVWKECEFGFTRDLIQWPSCHFTTDPNVHSECRDIPPWPTKDYTWDSTLWQACGPELTQDAALWCNPEWTFDPQMGPECTPSYTRDPETWPWCNPRYTQDPALWPNDCPQGVPYTYDDDWPECVQEQFTLDPYRWPACHYTSDPAEFPECSEPYPTQDYTSNPDVWGECPGPDYTMQPDRWPWCNPEYTRDPQDPTCGPTAYTQSSQTWPWCADPLYTANSIAWPECHFTSDPGTWPEGCKEPFPTKDFTWDTDLWPECGERLTYDEGFWCEPDYTSLPDSWPWCDAAWTWDPTQWSACEPGYTNDPDIWPVCREGLYTQEPAAWVECRFYTGDAHVWPECHFTSDPTSTDCAGVPFATKDYTTDPTIWPECEAPPGYTSDPSQWSQCHYTSDPQTWPECEVGPEAGDLGDAPDSTNHAGVAMTAYPAGSPPGVAARYPTVFDPATGLPQGPKHRNPRVDAWLGPWATLEKDADLVPDEDPVINIGPVTNAPDRDGADDGVVFPVPGSHCARSVMTYTVTVAPTALQQDRYVNVWFDWTRDGDWSDIPVCPSGSAAPEWAVQNQVLPPMAPGFYTFTTPTYLPWNPLSADYRDTWMRISIAEQPAPTVPGANLADGSGPPNGYEYGETEDYYFPPDCPPPVADFVWDPPTICPTTTVYFWDTSTNTPTSWSWDFGDSLGSSSLQNPTYTYSIAGVGTYDVVLTVGNVCGTDAITKTLVVTDCTTQDPDYDIYIKDNDTDDGSVPSSSPWYIGPDVWVRNSADGGTDHQNPVPGATNYVYVRVHNRLTTTVDDITVSVYWANVALGTAWPGSWGYINSFNIASLAGGAEIIKWIPWNTPYSTGHFCLRARADAPDDPVDSGPDTIAPTHWPPNNNNIAQKNVNIVQFPEIEHCGIFTTTVYTDVVYFDAFNTKNTTTTVDIEFDSPDFPLGSGTLIVEPGSLWGRWSTLTNFNQSGNTLLPTAFPAVMGDIEMTPYETARMTMTIAAEIDERFSISVEEKVDDVEVGGILYIRELPICAYLPLILREWP